MSIKQAFFFFLACAPCHACVRPALAVTEGGRCAQAGGIWRGKMWLPRAGGISEDPSAPLGLVPGAEQRGEEEEEEEEEKLGSGGGGNDKNTKWRRVH